MKKGWSILLIAAMLLTTLIPSVSAADTYQGKTVLLYTGNIRGNIDVYAQIAAVKADYQAKGAEVVLVDVGNFLQGTAYANSDRGLSVYNLMDAAGYDAAALGKYDFGYGEATTGYLWHSNLHRYYTQAELQNGAEELTYAVNSTGDLTSTRPVKHAAGFTALVSNLAPTAEQSGYYAFRQEAVIEAGSLKLGLIALTDWHLNSELQDGFLKGYEFTENLPIPPENCDVTICLSNAGSYNTGADLTIEAAPEDGLLTGAYVIDNAGKTITAEPVTLSAAHADAAVSALTAAVKANASPTAGSSTVTLNGSDRDNWNGETNLGDLTADALKWYAENYIEGLDKSLPVIAIQNGGNCDHYIYPGDLTEVDLLRALPFSPMGIGILYMTGAQLLESLEAATQRKNCPGWPQVSGMEYTVAAYKDYDAGEEYGKFYKADSIQRVTITSVGGADFDPNATYAVVADNFLMNGNDTYYTFKEVMEADGSFYLNNGSNIKVRDVVARYIENVLNGTVGDSYYAPQGRITVLNEKPYVNPYSDVMDGIWYCDAVKYVTQHGLMDGTGTGRFEPELALTRAMMVTVLYRLAGSPEASCYDNPFADVPENDWYTDAICWAAANQIVDGMGEDKFHPLEGITREQAAVILYRYAQLKTYDTAASTELNFPDAGNVSTWAETAMHWAVASGVIGGIKVADGGIVLDPQGSTTRAQLAALFMRFAENVVK